MGYTHYFSFKSAPKGKLVKTEQAYQRAIMDCTRIIKHYSALHGGLSGFSAHAPVGLYRGLKINGSVNSGQCEDFILRERFEQNLGFNFCKTRQYSYDTVVTACLIVLKHRLGSLVSVSSDGFIDDWEDGLELAKTVLKLKTIKIPASLRNRQDYKESKNDISK